VAEFEFWDCFIGIPEDAFVTVPEAATRFGIAPQTVKCEKLGGRQETTPQVQAQKEQLSAKDRQFGELPCWCSKPGQHCQRPGISVPGGAGCGGEIRSVILRTL
jgi:hypothetical protein